jgi:RNA polymerase sigma-70 factor (ECF subfamily)
MSQVLPLFTVQESTLQLAKGTKPTRIIDLDYLLHRVLSEHDNFAFNKLYHFYYTPLFTYCLKYIKDENLAQEVVNDVFVKIWKNKNTLTITNSAKGYLFTAVKNTSFDYLRKNKNNNKADLNEAIHFECVTAKADVALDNEKLYDVVMHAIEKLPTHCKQIFRMSREEGLKYHEIATKLGISIKTVETQVSRALKVIRTKVLAFESSYHPYL